MVKNRKGILQFMKTETAVQNKVKEERRRVFWRLYTLPWIISLIVLMLISFGFIWVIRDLKIDINEREEQLRSIGKVEGQREIQQDAIDNGHGQWEVSREGEVDFVWSEVIKPKIPKPVIIKETSIITNEVIRIITNEIIRVENPENIEIRSMAEDVEVIRDHPFGIDDFELAKRLGINLEKELIDRTSLAISHVLDYTDESIPFSILESRLQAEVIKNIRYSFDGFETYHKVK